MTLKDFLREILVVIVLYNRKAAAADAFRSLSAEPDVFSSIEVFLYDNSRDAAPAHAKNIIYHHSESNNGVSRAYNDALKIAHSKKKKWLLLFDQDTKFDRNFFEHLFHASCVHPHSYVFVPRLIDKQGIVSPFRWKLAKGRRIKNQNEKLNLAQFRFANSGALLATAPCQFIGGYDDDIPLDFSDIAFGEKLLGVTDHFVVVNVDLPHCLSSTHQLSLPESAERFQYFSNGAFVMGEKFGRAWLFRLRTFLRAINLTLFYKNPVFLKMLWQNGR